MALVRSSTRRWFESEWKWLKVLPNMVTFNDAEDSTWRIHLFGWIGDHSPRHVHVYRDGELVVKWDLDNWAPMKDSANARLLKILTVLVQEGKL